MCKDQKKKIALYRMKIPSRRKGIFQIESILEQNGRRKLLWKVFILFWLVLLVSTIASDRFRHN